MLVRIIACVLLMGSAVGCGSQAGKVALDCTAPVATELVQELMALLLTEGGIGDTKASPELMSKVTKLVAKHGLTAVRCAVEKALEALNEKALRSANLKSKQPALRRALDVKARLAERARQDE